MKDRVILTDAPYDEGELQQYLEGISRNDRLLFNKLKAMGFPSEGIYRLTSTRADKYKPTYKGFKDFTVKTLAVLVANLDEVDLDSFAGMFQLSSGPQVWRVWRIWMMDITCDGIDSYFHYLWNGSIGGGVLTIENISSDLQLSLDRHGQGRATRSVIEQLMHLIPALKIIEIEEERNRGRPKDSGLIREGNKWQALDFVRQKAREIYFSGNEFSMHKVARACGGRYRIRAEDDSCFDRCVGCKAIYDLIKKCNPDGTWDSEVLVWLNNQPS